MEPAVSVRPRWKNHEIQTADNSECDNPLNVCPVVEEEMDEEEMDDKEEPSEERRGVGGGQTRMMMTSTLRKRQEHEPTHIPFRSWVQTLCCCTGKQSCSPRSKVCYSGRGGQGHETSELRLLLHARSAGVRISKDSGIERPRFPHGVSSCGTNETRQSLSG